MTATTMHGLPPLLVAAVTYAMDQPPLGHLQHALDTAQTQLHMDDTAAREIARTRFMTHATPDGLATADEDTRIAAVVDLGDAGYLLGFATCWLLLHGKDGAR